MCKNKFGTENNFILDYLSESSRHEANILSKWVLIFSSYPPYTATLYNTPVSCSQIAMSPQHVLSVRSLSSVSVIILIWRLCQNIISIASSNLQNYGIEILKRKEIYIWESIHSFRCNTSLHSDKLVWKRYCGAGWILPQLWFIWGAINSLSWDVGFCLLRAVW